MKILIVLAHPNLSSSKVNLALYEGVKNLPGLEILDLYQKYGTIPYGQKLPHLGLEEDRKKMEAADKIILQFPFYWSSAPALLKGWLDEVLSYGWAHHGGVIGQYYALEGKRLGLCLVCGGNEKSYTFSGYNMHDLSIFLFPFAQLARTVKMNFYKHFAVFGSMHITEVTLKNEIELYKKYISETLL